MKRLVFLLLMLIAAASVSAQKPLEIYVIDPEGGKAALWIAPSGETVLIDSGNPGARDLDRLKEVFAATGVKRIDYLISTHYHVDHIGGLQELVKGRMAPIESTLPEVWTVVVQIVADLRRIRRPAIVIKNLHHGGPLRAMERPPANQFGFATRRGPGRARLRRRPLKAAPRLSKAESVEGLPQKPYVALCGPPW